VKISENFCFKLFALIPHTWDQYQTIPHTYATANIGIILVFFRGPPQMGTRPPVSVQNMGGQGPPRPGFGPPVSPNLQGMPPTKPGGFPPQTNMTTYNIVKFLKL
jgi:hypothetical protein